MNSWKSAKAAVIPLNGCGLEEAAEAAAAAYAPRYGAASPSARAYSPSRGARVASAPPARPRAPPYLPSL